MKLSRIAAALMAMASASVFAGNVLIIQDSTYASYSNIDTNLAARQAAAGNTATIVSSGYSGSFAGYSQIWDLRITNAVAAVPSSYLGYLQGGGTLFLLGENAGFATRNNSIANFLTSVAGAGTVTVTASNSGNSQTVAVSFRTPNAISGNTVTYAAVSAFGQIGNGTCVTTDANGKCGAASWGVGTMANTNNKGAVISILDINFMSSGAVVNQAFIDNLIAYFIQQNIISTTPSSFVPAANTTTVGLARVLDQVNAGQSIDPAMSNVLTSLQGYSQAQQTNALQRIAPTAGNGGRVASYSAGAQALNVVGSRLDSQRGTLVAFGEPSFKSPVLVAAAGSVHGLLEAKEEATKSVWGKFFGGDTRQKEMDGFAGYKAGTWGMALGADSSIGDGRIAGVAFTYSQTNLNQGDFLTGNGADIKSYQLTGYGTQNFGKWYLDGMLAYAQQRFETARDTTITGIARASYSGEAVTFRIGGGMPIALSKSLTLTPIGSLEWVNLKQGGYTESGAGPLNLSVQGTSNDRVRSSVGARLYADKLLGKEALKGMVQVAWNHDFRTAGLDTVASLAGGGAAFATPGQSIKRDMYAIALGGSFVTGRNHDVSLRYDAEAATKYVSQAVQVVGRWFF